jgi:hypothetical protein
MDKVSRRGGSRGSQISHATKLNVKKRHIKKFGLRFLNFFPAQARLFISDHVIFLYHPPAYKLRSVFAH